VSGGSLDKEMAQGPMDPVRVMKIGQQMADALALAADQGLVHGDVKPENVLFDSDGNAKLVDFGLAAMQGDSDEIWGTPYYISPEKVRKQKIDYRADIYSLGGTLYHALTGEAPFEGVDATAVVKARFEGAPRKPSEVRADLPPELDAIILRMLELEPAMRYPTYSSLMGDFKRFLAKAGPAKTSHGAGPRVKIKGARIKMKLSSGDDGATTGMTPLAEGEVPELTAVEGEEAVEEKHMNIGLVVGLVVVGVILLIGAVVGGLIWYKHAETKAAAEAERAMITGKYAEARDAVVKTLGVASQFGEKFGAEMAKADKDMDAAMRKLKAILPPELKELAAGMLEPPPSADITAAIDFTNKLFAVAAVVAPVEAAPTNAPAAGTNAVAKASGTNAVAAVAAGTNATAAVAAKAADAKKAAGEEKKSEEKEEAEEAEKPAEEAKPAYTVPAAVKKFAELWADAYYCRAWNIRVQGQLTKLLQEGEAVKTLTEADEATIVKLADLGRALTDQYNALINQKEVVNARRKASQINTRATRILTDAANQFRIFRMNLEKAARDKVEAEKKAAAEAAAAEARKARVEEEVKKASEKFDYLVSSRLKYLDWEGAVKQFDSLKADATTAEGKAEIESQVQKIRCMQTLHKLLCTKTRGFKFRSGAVVAAVDDKSISIQKYRIEKKKSVPDGRPQKINWTSFYGKKENTPYMNQFINKLVMKGRETVRLGPKPWSECMLGAALTLQLLYTEVEGAAEFAPKLVTQAVEGFAPCRRHAEKWFPDVKLPAAEEE